MFVASYSPRIAALLVLLALSACQRGAPPPQGPPPAPEVSVAAVIEREVNEWDEFTGHLQAVERVEIRPRVTGYIESVNFQEGKEVKKGDVLFVIDPRPYQAELNRAAAEAAQTQARLQLAKSELERAARLLKTRMVSQQLYDERNSAVREAEAALQAARAAEQNARLNMEFTRVTSPIDGRASRAEVTAGNLVTGGASGAPATLLTTVVSLDPIYAYFEGDEQIYLKYVTMARSGERASSREVRNPIYLGLANEQGHPHQGYMDFVDNQLNPATGTIRARAVFDNKERLLTPGLFARLKLIGSGTFKAVLINDRAVGTDQNKKFVLVLGADNKVEYRPVQIGRLIEGLRVVKEGLKPGEQIVVNGLQRVRPGMPVTPQTVPMEDAAQTESAPAPQ
ncbi:MAG: efflux RND transporter periplasmic adaptor subunit [Pseudomonadota bacterium]